MNFFRNSSLLIVATVVGLLLAEGVLRLYLKATADILPAGCRKEDKVLHHGLTSKQSCQFKTNEWDVMYRINSLGMRDKEYSSIKPQGTFRILLLGDSFAEGYGVEESASYQNQLERLLNDRYPQINVEVINAGVQSYSPVLEYIYLLKVGLTFDPDLIFVNVDVTDFSDERRYQTFAKGDVFSQEGSETGEIVWEQAPLFAKPIPSVTWLPFIPTPVKWWLHQHSRVYDVTIDTLKRKLYPNTFKAQIDFTPNDPETDAFVIMREGSEGEKLWEDFQKSVMRIKTITNQKGIPTVFFMHPHGHQVAPDEWAEGRRAWAFEENKVYPTNVQERLGEWGAAEGLDVVNLVPPFKEAAGEEAKLFFPVDGHLTEAGHNVIAQALFLFVEQGGFVDLLQ